MSKQKIELKLISNKISRRDFIGKSTLLASGLLVSGLDKAQSDVIIIKKSASNSTIVLNSDATEGEKFAAKELQIYLKKISGIEIPIKKDTLKSQDNMILVGKNKIVEKLGINTEGLTKEGFHIKTIGSNLALVGHDDSGTQFAVYTFLERYLGVRWFWPGESGEVVPRRENIILRQIDDTEEPDFKWRNRGPGGALWGTNQGPTEMDAKARLLGITENHQKEVKLWEKRNKWGGMKIYGGHILSEIFPPEKYSKTHPEYYALVNGKRDVPRDDYDHKHECQVCTTNPDVLQVAVEWARNFFDSNTDYDAVNMSMNDGMGFCECKVCLALDSNTSSEQPDIAIEETKEENVKNTVITDRIFTFYNQVTEELHKTHPEKYIVVLAYSRYSQPPSRVGIHPYLIPQYCLWSAYKHANIDIRESHKKITSEWSKLANKMGIYEYYINGAWPGMHRLVMPYIAESIKDLKRQGIDLYQTQSGDEFAINGLNYYVAGKLLWDTSLDLKAILDDFYQKAFGSSGKAIRQFHQRLREAWKMATQNGVDVKCDKNTCLLEYFTPDLLEECRKDLEDAEKAADNEKVLERIDFYKKGFQYTVLTVDAVKVTKELEKLGTISIQSQNIQNETERMKNGSEKDTIIRAFNAWVKRDRYVEELKNDYVLPYFWVKYNDHFRRFNPFRT
ncbi:MAG: DUF4838 domain-containing protein [Mangrovibacterium sp.]|nr:DUF4838 domain-containing protein [Mangrovibacterium sp.]